MHKSILSKKFLKQNYKIYKISCFIIFAIIIFNFNPIQYNEISQFSKTDNISSSIHSKDQLSNIGISSSKALTYAANSASNQNYSLSTLPPHGQGVLETQEEGTFTKNQSAYTPVDNSAATLINANLSSLKYTFNADTESSGTYTQDWQIPVDTNSGHAPGSVSIDTKNYVQGTASAHFIMNKTASTWYTTFNEPVWNDSHLPSPFLYSTLLSGYFSFNATNLATDPYGYISMLRFAFPGTSGLAYSAINIFMNISSGYSVPSSGIQVDSICCVLGIYLGQNKSDQRVQLWQQKNSWYGFRINLTQILQDVYPVNSSLYSSATQVFTNLTKTWIELQSQTQSSGTLHLWIDNLQWQSNLSKAFAKQWINSNPPFINKNGSFLTNQSINIAVGNSWSNNNDWSVITKNNSILTKNLPVQSPYVPVWLFRRINVYVYNFIWYINIDNSTWWNACQSIAPDIHFAQNSISQCNLNQSMDTIIKILPSFFQTNSTIKSSMNIVFAWQILDNSKSLAPQNYSSYTTNSMLQGTQFNPNYKLSANQDPVIQATIQTYTANNTVVGWYAFQWTASLVSQGFNVFPIVKLYMVVPNLLSVVKYPVLSITQQGLSVELAINLTMVNHYLPLVAQIYTTNWINTENYVLGGYPDLSIFLAWQQPINLDDQIYLQILINSSQEPGWYSTSFVPRNLSLNNTQSSNQSSVIPTSENTNSTAIPLLNGDMFFFIMFYGICSVIGITIVGIIRRSQRKHIVKDLFEE